MNKRKTFTLSIATALIFSVLLSISGFDAKCHEIENEVLRLHVIANSDKENDQALKLKVRDEVLRMEAKLWKTAENKPQAMDIVKEHIDEIEDAAQEIVRENGYNYPVNATLTNCYFPTREYENFTLPAGNYDALRITIGEAKGKNWWCVLFPEICLGAAADFSSVLSEESENIVSNPSDFQVKFKVVELYRGVKEKISAIF